MCNDVESAAAYYTATVDDQIHAEEFNIVSSTFNLAQDWLADDKFE